MIIRREELQDVCNKILSAVDASEISAVTETLELVTDDSMLYLKVTNREYLANVRLNVDDKINFHATVNATLFLKLISQITTDTIEMTVNDSCLTIKGNGTYKLPLVLDDNDELLTLPTIDINNVTGSFNIHGEILTSILNYNTKELTKCKVSNPIQKMYYMDNHGAITFTNGACVNKFELEQPIKVLLNQKIVKLFKLFKDEEVRFTIGHDSISDDIIQTKVRFETDTISITAILNDDSLVSGVPVDAIRGRVENVYPHSVTINRDAILQTINRLLLFANLGKGYNKPFSEFHFKKDRVVIYDNKKENSEEIYYVGDEELSEEYTNMLDLTDVKSTLESCNEQYVNVNFGDGQAVVVVRSNVYNVIPEVISE